MKHNKLSKADFKQLKQLVSRNKRLGLVFAAVVLGGLYYSSAHTQQIQSLLKGLKSRRKEPVKDLSEQEKADVAEKSERRRNRKKLQNRSLSQVWKELFKYGSKELRILVMLAICSTLVSNSAARIQATLFKNIFQGEPFWWNFGFNILHGVAQCIIDSSREYTVSMLQIKLREQITRNVHRKYFQHLNYYYLMKVDRKIGDVEQRITEDVQLLTKEVSDLANSFLGSLSDVVLYTFQLRRTTGTNMYSLSLLLYILTSGTLATRMMPNFTRLFRKQEELEGQYQNVQARLQENSESIVFYEGLEAEQNTIFKYFKKVTSNYANLIQVQWQHQMLRDFFLKYAASTVAMIVILKPFFGGQYAKSQNFSQDAEMVGKMRYNTSVVLNLFKGLGQIAATPSQIKKLQAYAERIQEIDQVIKSRPQSDQIKSGEDIHSDDIIFEDVQIKTPLNNELVNNLNLTIKCGQKLLIVGPNGAGKSSLFRVLGDLWPLEKGKIFKPTIQSGLSRDIFYIPQRPYVTYGTLEDQILYPEESNDQNKVSKDSLSQLLKEVELEYLTQRSGVLDWNNILSLGEQQRLGMARLFYHKPKFAILDECTSAVTNEMAVRFYKQLQKLNCSYITISHRPTLRDFHDFVLALDGEGGWETHEINQQTSPRRNNWTRLDQKEQGSFSRKEDSDQVNSQMIGSSQLSDDVAYTSTNSPNDSDNDLYSNVIAKAPSEEFISRELPLRRSQHVNMQFSSVEECTQQSKPQQKRNLFRDLRFKNLYEKVQCYFSAEGQTVSKWKKVLLMLGLQRQLKTLFFPSMILVIVLRTFLSNKIARLNGATVDYLLRQDYAAFQNIIGVSLIQCAAQAIVSPSLAYLTNQLRLQWRRKLTFYLLKLYLKQYPFYAINHLFQGSYNLKAQQTQKRPSQSPSSTLSSKGTVDLTDIQQQQYLQHAPADQKLTKHVQQMCNELASLVPNAIKPMVDLTWFTASLGRLTGVKGLLICYSYMLFGTITLRSITPDLASYSQKQMELEGIFYQFHSRFQMQAEQIAFYGGGPKEGSTIAQVFDQVIQHSREFAQVRFRYRIFDEFLTKHLPNNLTWILSLAYTRDNKACLIEGGSKSQQGAILFDLRYMAAVVSQCFQAFGDLLQLNGRMQEIHGFVNQITQTSEFLEKAQEYQESQISRAQDSGVSALQNEEGIVFERASICPPYQSQTLLVRGLDLDIGYNQNTLVTGPNGSGKTALTRVLRGLWPLLDGRYKSVGSLVNNDDNQFRTAIFFVPQKPYMTIGTLKQQIIYPRNLYDEIWLQPGGSYRDKVQALDDKLVEMLGVIKLSYLIERGWDEEKEWGEILSLGEQQRIGMARAFYNQPRFAIFDECTNATSLDVEQLLYQEAISRGITVVTITQRSALLQFHDKELRLIDGKGDWVLKQINHESSSGSSIDAGDHLAKV